MKIFLCFWGFMFAMHVLAQGFETTVHKIYMNDPCFSYRSGDSCESINSDSVKYLWLTLGKNDTTTCFMKYDAVTAITIEGNVKEMDERFRAFKQLKSIWLWANIKELPSFISDYKDLECLIIFPKIRIWNTKSLSSLTNLRYLGWYQKEFPKILYSIPNLKVLSLAKKPKRITLEKFQCLEKVFFEFGSPIDEVFEYVKNNRTLKEIEISYIYYNYLQYDEIRNFLKLPSLLKLEIVIYIDEIAINNQKLEELKMQFLQEGKQLIIKRLLYSHNSKKSNVWVDL